jgi:hypothetical protein
MRYIMGADVSLNHAGFVLLDELGEIIMEYFVTDKAKVAALSKVGIYFGGTRVKDMNERGALRLSFWNKLSPVIVRRTAAWFVGIEDYAFRAPQFAHQIGEVGGAFRHAVWESGACIRFIDPPSVKMFAAHDGTASDIVPDVMRRWPATKQWERYTVGQDARTTEDLCDAFILAMMVLTELKLREGTLKLSELHPKEIQIFNRTTKRNPVNVLARDWVKKNSESKEEE